jgi:hypothetical protein
MAVAQVSLPRTSPARSLAVDLQHLAAWVRRSLPFAWVPAACGLALVPALVGMLDGRTQWAALGGLALAVVWGQLVSYAAWSRSQQLAVPARAPQRTTGDVLRPLRRQGWKVVGDGIAIGPGGVVVLESKYRRTITDEDLAWAARHVQRRKRQLAGLLLPVLDGAPVVPVIVTWAGEDGSSRERAGYVDGVALVAGEDLAGWLEVFGRERLSPTQVVTAWARVLNDRDAGPAAAAAVASSPSPGR